MKRVIARSIDINSKHYAFDKKEIIKAFERANDKKDTILSYFFHDYRDLRTGFEPLLENIWNISKKYPAVKIVNANALTALHNTLNLKPKKLTLKMRFEGNFVIAESNRELFGEQPFLAVKFSNNEFKRIDMKRTGNLWLAELPKKAIEKIGIAANNYCGAAAITNKKIIGQNNFEKRTGAIS